MYVEHLRGNWRELDDDRKQALLKQISELTNVDFIEQYEQAMSSIMNFKLLDGTTHNYNELLDMMLEDAFYYGYLGKAALSSSTKGCYKAPQGIPSEPRGAPRGNEGAKRGKAYTTTIGTS